jgi:TP901 family phage tail tape measure protein
MGEKPEREGREVSIVGEMLVAVGVNTAPLTAGMVAANAELRGFATEADATGKKASSSFNAVGVASLAIVGGVAVIGAESIKSATTFQSAMTLIQTQAGGSAAEVANMTQAVLALAPTVGMGPDVLAAGLYHIESAGLRGAQALDVLRVAAEGAKVGHADLETVTNALVAANQSGVKGVESMTGAMGTLNAIVGAGNMRMQDLTDAMGTGVLSTAKNYGVTIQSVGAALADMTDQGIPAVDAATRLNSAMRLMAAPTKAAKAELASIGISSMQLANDMRGPGGIASAVDDLKSHLDASGLSASKQAALIAAAFGGKQSGAILTLIGNVDLLAAKNKAVADGAGAFGDAWATTEATTEARSANISASISAMSDAIGLALLPAVDQLLGAITPVISGLSSWAIANPQLTVQILAITGAVAALVAGVIFLGPILGAIGSVIGIVASPIVLLLGAIVALAAHFGLLGKGAQDAFNGLIGQAQAAVPGIVSKVGDMAQAFLSWIGPMIGPALAALGDFASQIIGWIGAQLPGWVAQLGQWAQAFIAWIGPMIPPALAALGRMAGQIVSWIGAQLPGWGRQLGQWAGAFVGWVGQVGPPLLNALGGVLDQALSWISTEAPVLLGQLVDWAGAFIGWITPMIPPALAALTNVLVGIINWIADPGVPRLAKAVLEFAKSFVANAVPKLIDLTGKLLTLIIAVAGWMLTDGAPKIAAAAVNLGVALVKGFIDVLTGSGGQPGLIADIGAAIGDLIGAVPGWLGKIYDAFLQIGKKILGGIVDGIGNLGSQVGGAIQKGVGSIPGVGAIAGGLGDLLHFAGGGIVPGFGPQLIVAHGGETILPPDYLTSGPLASPVGAPGGSSASASGGSTRLESALEAFTAALLRAIQAGVPITLDGREIGDMLDQRLRTSLTVYQPLSPTAGSQR